VQIPHLGTDYRPPYLLKISAYMPNMVQLWCTMQPTNIGLHAKYGAIMVHHATHKYWPTCQIWCNYGAPCNPQILAYLPNMVHLWCTLKPTNIGLHASHGALMVHTLTTYQKNSFPVLLLPAVCLRVARPLPCNTTYIRDLRVNQVGRKCTAKPCFRR
jgi:hypothetical protein